MMRILYAASFLRAYKKLPRESQGRVDVALDIFQMNPFDPRLRNHKLSGPKRDLRSISAGYDLRILYRESGGHLIVVIATVGKHDDVY